MRGEDVEAGRRAEVDTAGGLVDELFVTMAPKLSGGVGPGLIAGLGEQERDLELAWLLAEESTGELFGRYLAGAAT